MSQPLQGLRCRMDSQDDLGRVPGITMRTMKMAIDTRMRVTIKMRERLIKKAVMDSVGGRGISL